MRELDLTLIASQIQTIKASTSNSIIFDATNCKNIVIDNLKFDGGNFSNVIVVKNSLEIINSVYYDIKNCTFVNLDKGIENCNIAHLNINNCNFSNNKIAIKIYQTTWGNSYNAILSGNKVNGNEIGIKIDDYTSSFNISRNSIIDNLTGILFKDNCYHHGSITYCTITDNDIGIDFDTYATPSAISILSCIIYGNDSNLSEPTNNTIITYSDIQGGFTGTGNINQDPKFSHLGICSYFLVEGSPCIDAGDPNLTDSDGTRFDMGCFSTANLDLKELQGNHWNWVSFPRLPREDNDPVNAPSILEQMLPMPGSMVMKDDQANLSYSGTTWFPSDYPITSDLGYKLNPEEAGTFTLPEHGTRLPANYTTHIYANQPKWIGYWLPQTQSVIDALGSQLDHIIGIKAENWYMKKIDGQWYGMGSVRATFEYGKGYEVITDGDMDLQWQFGSITPAYKSEQPENFTYTQKADYEMIDIDAVDGADNVTEIGAFVDGVCVGASKVTEYPVHILAYTDAVNRGSEFSFEVVTGRGVEKINNTQKYNFASAKFENSSVYPTGSGFSRVRLSIKINNNDSVSPIKLESNYPNPFSISGERGNAGTTIAFTIPENENVKVTIYNVKGQKVKSLLDKNCSKGRTSIIWNGTDDSNKKVSSGVYFYRLETKQKSINKKMILIK